ncbi:helicase-associated domain-containing protein [Paenibacillus puldeungensis]|uniref:Helicase-associated domain-containing protein n=1 Tax=Paenibacillus puldeungensis TaxID=696536 RepID=A0ABW3RUK2_9BACL
MKVSKAQSELDVHTSDELLREKFPLPETAHAVLLQLYRKFAGQPFKLEAIRSAARDGWSGAELRAALPSLLRQGDVKAVKKAWGEKLFYIPLNRILQLQQSWGYSSLNPWQPKQVMSGQESKAGLAVDLFRAITWIAENGLRITAKGTIHQKEQGKLESRIELSEHDVIGLQLNYPHQDVYSPQLAVILDLLMGLDLIDKDRAFWRLNHFSLKGWLNLDIQTMNMVLLRQILQRYVPSEAGLQHVALRLATPDLEKDTWYSRRELLNSLTKLGYFNSGYAEERKDWINAWLQAMAGFGWMELGENQEGEAVFRWIISRDRLAITNDHLTKERNIAKDGYIIVQPDFEILVPPDVPMLVRFELEACSENIIMDTMSVYRISKDSVKQASKHGRTPDDILAFLRKHAAYVPESIILALQQWGREFGRVAFEEKLLLRCADHEAAERIYSLPSLQGKVERISPLDFIVPPEEEGKIRKILEEQRLSPRDNRNQSGEEQIFPRIEEEGISKLDDPESAQMLQGQGWIFKGAGLHFYEADNELPSAEQLFPGLQELPVMWWKETRAYHSSTARKIIAQAMEWHTKLRVQIAGKPPMECLPVELIGGEDWSVKVSLSSSEGNLLTNAMMEDIEVVLSSNDIETLRLLVPEMM